MVGSAYEAAAELLAEPAAALVVDLRRIGPRHAGLLAAARRQGVETLAFGAIPARMTSEDLSGVRLTALADLPEALERIVSRSPAGERAGQPPAATPEEEPASQPAEPIGPAPAIAIAPRQEPDVPAKPEPGAWPGRVDPEADDTDGAFGLHDVEILLRHLDTAPDWPDPYPPARIDDEPAQSAPAAEEVDAEADEADAAPPARSMPPGQPAEPTRPPAARSDGLLTPEELAALLGDLP